MPLSEAELRDYALDALDPAKGRAPSVLASTTFDGPTLSHGLQHVNLTASVAFVRQSALLAAALSALAANGTAALRVRATARALGEGPRARAHRALSRARRRTRPGSSARGGNHAVR